MVFFGATGDLAHKMVFPALQALVKKGRLDVPIVGVAKAGWNLEQLRERVRDRLATFGGGVDAAAFVKLSALLRYVDGDYEDPRSFDQLRVCLGELGAGPGGGRPGARRRLARADRLRLEGSSLTMGRAPRVGSESPFDPGSPFAASTAHLFGITLIVYAVIGVGVGEAVAIGYSLVAFRARGEGEPSQATGNRTLEIPPGP